MVAVTEPLIRGVGTAEADWRTFLAVQPGRVLSTADLLPRSGRAIVVAPHPDDELLGIGATLHALALAGCETVLVSVTQGEASHPGSRQWTPHELGMARSAERDDGLRRLGWEPDRVIDLDLPDGGVAACEDDLADALTGLVGASDAVFATWRRDGHPDHDATGRAAARACTSKAATLREFPVWMWHWAVPRDARVPWSLLARFPYGSATRRAKRGAISAHMSQLTFDATTGRPPVLPPHVLRRFDRTFESIFV